MRRLSSDKRRGHIVRVRVVITLEVDVDAYNDAYGTSLGAREVAADVRESVYNVGTQAAYSADMNDDIIVGSELQR